ncbi:MAG: 30S ribosome-binding factor RbfA [Gammaproteobacteria bacterium]
MPKEFSRARRVEEQIKRELASLIKSEVDQPSLGLVTFTAVESAPDLSLAKVYFTILGSDLSEKESENILNDSSPHLRHCLSQVMTLRSVPRLKFFYDVSIERGNKMEALLDEVVREDTNSSENSG